MVENGSDASKLSVKLELNSNQYKAEDQQQLKFTLNNNSDETLNVLKWYTPLEGLKDDLFTVKKQGESALYLGIIVKRGLPKPRDYITLEPKESISTEVNLDDVYDITQAGNYAVEFISPVLDVGKEEPAALAAKFSETRTTTPQLVASNTVEFKLLEDKNAKISQGVELAFRERLSAAEVPIFSNCSNNQQSQIDEAIEEAKHYANESLQKLIATSEGARIWSVRYKEWFGAYLGQRYETVIDHFDKITDAVVNKRITFNCTCDIDNPENTFAYVSPARPYEIFLCNQFWEASLTGTDSKAGTIIHELSHFYVVAGTTDTGGIYGQEDCRRLASENPLAALRHADCHEYFAENSPQLTM
jgi:peptidyl-Lys metalloendopeptidase